MAKTEFVIAADTKQGETSVRRLSEATRSLEQDVARLARAAENRSAERFASRLHAGASAARVFGGESAAAAKQQDILRREIERLIRSGVDPASARIWELKRSYDAISESSRRASEESRRLEERLAQQSAMMSTLGTNMSRYVTLPLLAAGGAGIKFAADMESSQVALSVLLKDAEKAQEVFNDWQQFSAATPFQLDDIQKAGKNLIAFGESADTVTAALRRIGDVSAGIGASISEIAEIYGKARVQQTLYAQDINQLAGRGIPVFTELAKVMGVNESQIKQLASEGKIQFGHLEQAFINMTSSGGQFEGLMEQLSETTAGKFSTAVDNIKLGLAGLMEEALPLVNAGLETATEALREFNALDSGTKRMIISLAGVAAATGPIIKGVQGISLAFKMLKQANPWLFVASAAIMGITALVSAADDWKEKVEEMKVSFQETKRQSDEFFSSIGDITDGTRLSVEQYDKLLSIYPELADKTDVYSSSIADLRKQIQELHREKAMQAIAEIGDSAANPFKAAAGLESKIAGYREGLASLEEQKKEALANGWESHLEVVENAIDRTLEQIAEAEANLLAAEGERRASEAEYRRLAEEQAKIYGFTLNEELKLIPIEPPVIPQPEPENVEPRAWQEWFNEVAGTGLPIAEESGAEFAQAYIAQLMAEENELRQLQEFFGRPFDQEASVDRMRAEVMNLVKELMSIGESEIDIPFTFKDNLMEELRSFLETMKVEIPLELQAGGALEVDSSQLEQFSWFVQAADNMGSASQRAAQEMERQQQQLEYLQNTYDLSADKAQRVNEIMLDRIDLTEQEAIALANLQAVGDEFVDSLAGQARGLGNAAGQGDALGVAGGIWDAAVVAGTAAAGPYGPLVQLGAGLLEGIVGAFASIVPDNTTDYGSYIPQMDEFTNEMDTLTVELADLRIEISELRKIEQEKLANEKKDYNDKFRVLEDAWKRREISTEEFQAQKATLDSEYDTKVAEIEAPRIAAEEEAAKIKEAQEVAQEKLATARQNKLSELATEALEIQKKLNDMSEWDRFWSGDDEKYAKQLAEYDARIAVVQNATTLKDIEAAATGADFVTNGPQLLLVGDNPGGKERVSVEPISSPNIHGPKGGGVHITVQGPVYGIDDFAMRMEEAKRSLIAEGRLTHA